MAESLTLYKLIILYMLNKVNFPLTNSQISSFLLENDYTDYFHLQQAFSELTEADLIFCETVRNSSLYHITKEGQATLDYFGNKIPDAIIKDIHTFLNENKLELRKEVSVMSDYYKTTSGDFAVHGVVKERNTSLMELTVTVPDKEQAEQMCNNWKEKSQDIYETIMSQLLNS